MENQITKNKKLIKKALLRVTATALFCVLLSLIMIATQYNTETRLLNVNFFTGFVNLAVIVAIIYTAIEFFAITQKFLHFSGEVITRPVTLVGALMLFASACFLIQFFFDFIEVYQKSLLLLKAAGEESNFFTIFGDKNVISIVGALLCLLCVIYFLVDGLSILWQKKSCPFWLRLVPPIWAGMVLLDVMMSYPAIVSAHSDFLKVFCCIITVLFLYHTCADFCEVREKKKRSMSMFIRLSYPVLLLISSGAYGFAAMWFTKGETKNVPYIAFFGIGVFSILLAVQLLMRAFYQMGKKERTPRRTEPRETACLHEEEQVPEEKASSEVEWSYFDE